MLPFRNGPLIPHRGVILGSGSRHGTGKAKAAALRMKVRKEKRQVGTRLSLRALRDDRTREGQGHGRRGCEATARRDELDVRASERGDMSHRRPALQVARLVRRRQE